MTRSQRLVNFALTNIAEKQGAMSRRLFFTTLATTSLLPCVSR
jgi:hypothetical protein